MFNDLRGLGGVVVNTITSSQATDRGFDSPSSHSAGVGMLKGRLL